MQSAKHCALPPSEQFNEDMVAAEATFGVPLASDEGLRFAFAAGAAMAALTVHDILEGTAKTPKGETAEAYAEGYKTAAMVEMKSLSDPFSG